MKLWSVFLCSLFINFAYSQIDGTAKDSVGRTNGRVEINLNPTPSINYVSPPAGYDTSGYFNGYVDLKRRSSIVIQELNKITPEQGKQAFESKMGYFAENGMTVLEIKDFNTNQNVPGFYMKVSYIHQSVTYWRYIVYVGNTSSLFLDVVFPEKEDLEKEMILCFHNISYDL